MAGGMGDLANGPEDRGAAGPAVDGGGSVGHRRVLVISGPSGSGKSTIVDLLVDLARGNLTKAVSATTRDPRPGEVDGEDYYFLSHDEFEARRRAGDFVETAEVHGVGEWYGTLASEIDRAADEGAWAILEIDVQGALTVIERFPDALSVFVRAPSVEDHERRLRGRATESEEVIQQRVRTAAAELELGDRYRFQVVNDNLERTVEEIMGILSNWEAEDRA